ncbi:hypothetical protein HJG60_012069 [Phyllostomus discolor]|uniref:Uncharacterized protein n=1 Tax=Phyllostomus discolor TaxID=89673 RepID=A0A833ZDR3_9CHIR|nr:hypothetical protein HJG60_012069 [Phyllostomus discolor]
MLETFRSLASMECSMHKTSRSCSRWNILGTEISSEDNIVRFTRNDSCSVSGEHWAFHDAGDQRQTHGKHLRSHMLEAPCERGEAHPCRDTLNPVTDLPVGEGHLPGVKPQECTKCGKPTRVSQGLPLDSNLIPVRNVDKPARASRVQALTWNQSVCTNPVTVGTLGEHLRDT